MATRKEMLEQLKAAKTKREERLKKPTLRTPAPPEPSSRKGPFCSYAQYRAAGGSAGENQFNAVASAVPSQENLEHAKGFVEYIEGRYGRELSGDDLVVIARLISATGKTRLVRGWDLHTGRVKREKHIAEVWRFTTEVCRLQGKDASWVEETEFQIMDH